MVYAALRLRRGDPAKRYKQALEKVLSQRLGEQNISLTQKTC